MPNRHAVAVALRSPDRAYDTLCRCPYGRTARCAEIGAVVQFVLTGHRVIARTEWRRDRSTERWLQDSRASRAQRWDRWWFIRIDQPDVRAHRKSLERIEVLVGVGC